MSLLFTFRPYSKEDKQLGIVNLLKNTRPDRDFYLLAIGAIILAACGILTDSIPVLIASMIVAPLAYPVLCLGFAIVVGDGKLFLRSLLMIILSIGIAIIIGGLFSLFVRNYFAVAERTLISFFPNIFFDLLIAVISGFIAAYGLVRSKVGEAMTGIGIAVSLMPPLVAIGIGLFNPMDDLAIRAATIFLLNLAGIIAGSSALFILFRIRREYNAIKNSLK